MNCMPNLSWWICHSERLWWRFWAHDLVTKTFTYVSLSLHIHARPPDPLPEMLFNFGDALVLLMCWLKNARPHYVRSHNAVDSLLIVDTLRVKSHVNGFFNPTGVPMWVSVNKFNLVPKRIMSELVSMF